MPYYHVVVVLHLLLLVTLLVLLVSVPVVLGAAVPRLVHRDLDQPVALRRVRLPRRPAPVRHQRRTVEKVGVVRVVVHRSRVPRWFAKVFENSDHLD